MSNYNLCKIVEQIGKGSKINLSFFNKILASKSRLKVIRHTEIEVESIKSLLRSLISINVVKLTLTVVLFVIHLSITILSPFLASFLIDNYLSEGSDSLGLLLIIFLTYKLFKSVVEIICDFCYQSLGYEYFARLYWHILTSHFRITGKESYTQAKF